MTTAIGVLSALLLLPSLLTAQEGRIDDEGILKAAIEAAVDHANATAPQEGRVGTVGAVWLDSVPTVQNVDGAILAQITAARMTKDSLLTRLADREEVVTCREEACQVSDNGIFVNEVYILRRTPEGRVLVELDYRVPTPLNTMGRMCPHLLHIEMVRVGESWEVEKVRRRNAC